MNKEKLRNTICFFRIIAIILLPIFLLIIISCGQESSEIIRRKLDVILSDDLNSIIKDIPKDGLINKPCYDLIFYKEYKEGNYSQKAIANFYFLRSVNAKIVRKYRYYRKKRMWERYFNEYSLSPDTMSNCRKE